MSTVENPAATEVKKPKAKKPAAKKSSKSKAAKKHASNGKPRARKEGLRTPQVRILAVLAKTSKPLDRKTIAEKAEVDLAWMVTYVGSSDDAIRKANDEREYPSLLTLGAVKQAKHEEGGGACYVITERGRKLLAEAQAAAKARAGK